MAAAPVALRRVAPGDVKALNLSPVDDVTLAQAGAIMKDVRAGGEAKLIEIAQKYGDIKAGEPHLLGRDALEAVFNSLPAVRTTRSGAVACCVVHEPVRTRAQPSPLGHHQPLVCLALSCAVCRTRLQDQQALLRRVAERIRAFAQTQRDSITDVSTTVPGGTAGHTVSPPSHARSGIGCGTTRLAQRQKRAALV